MTASRFSVDDRRFMARALAQARAAEKADEVPVGAVLVLDGKILAEDRNRIRALKDPAAHAEILVIRRAAEKLKNERLGGTILYASLEPCAMCAGALVLARVARVVYAASDPKAGGAGSVFNIVDNPGLNHRATVAGGLLRDESRRILRRFFQKRRGRKK